MVLECPHLNAILNTNNMNTSPLQSMRLLPMAMTLFAFLLVAVDGSCQTSETPEAQKTEKEVEKDVLLKEKWRHVGFHLISDVPGDDLESVMEEPSFGFALTTMKHDRKGLLDGGFDIGFQPIGGFDTTITVNDNGTLRDGTLHVRNQLAHAYYLLRMTLFQNSGFQPFVEGYAGVRGSFLGARLVLDDGDESTKINDVPYFSSNFNYGYAAGLRLRVGKRSFVTARYARMLHLDGGDVVQVADPSGISIDETGAVTSSRTVGRTLPPYSVRVGLAINL